VSLRTRLTLAAAGAVAVAVLVASIGVYFVVRGQLRGEVDSSLRQRAELIQRIPAGARPVAPGERFPVVAPADLGGASGYLQIVESDGSVSRPGGGSTEIPVTTTTLAVARGEAGMFLYDSTVAGTHVRVITAPLAGGAALQLVRPLNEVDGVLRRLRWILLAVMFVGVAVAAALGAAVSRTALAPVRRLTETTEAVSSTLDLSQRIETTGTDEIGRLAASFNRMLEALEGSVGAQRQLVADASHELRTPLTSLRVNIETLMRGDLLLPEDRARLGEDIVEQLGEMTVLIDEVVEVARGDEQSIEWESVPLDVIVAEVVDRARRNVPSIDIELRTDTVVVRGDPARLERAVANLVDNACKWSPSGGRVDVTLDEAGELIVRDHGPGFAETDLPHAFDRFYRSRDSRSLPGSGLGLAIVRQVAEAHGGTVVAANAPDGGAILRLCVPLENS
jgi:two-component system sensor histidine kinase MprB